VAEITAPCNRDSLYGVYTALETAKEAGMRPVIGAPLTKVINKEKGEIYCFVQHRARFERLYEILTMRNKDNNNYDPLAMLPKQSARLILASSDRGILEQLAVQVPRLYTGVTPSSLRAVDAGCRLNLPLAFLVHRVRRAIALDKNTGKLAEGDRLKKGRGSCSLTG
jgi:DNA polymerase-3 subunit alpha/error-prone DNA polymerase